MHLLRLSAAFAALALCTSCLQFQRTPGMTIASEPSGARIVIDGEDSGFVTPCNLGLSREKHRIDLELAGYDTARIQVVDAKEYQLIYWREATINPNTWHFPLWLNYEDGLAPITRQRGFSPGRIHVPMRLAAVE